MTTDSIVRFNTAGEFEVADQWCWFRSILIIVGYKSFDGSANSCVVDSTPDRMLRLSQSAKGTPVKLAGGTGVYSLQFKGYRAVMLMLLIMISI